MLAPEAVFVSDDGRGVAPLLVARLAAAGIAAYSGEALHAGTRQVVFLGGLVAVTDTAAAASIHVKAFSLAKQIAATPLSFITVQDTGGGFGFHSPDPSRGWLGGLPGLVKTAALEWPAANVKAIDLATAKLSAADIAAAVATELLHGGPEHEVALAADAQRYTLKSTPVAFNPPASLPLPERPVFIVSGGARGVTGQCLLALTHSMAPRLAIFGRSALVEEPYYCQGVEGSAALKNILLQAAKAAGKTVTPASLNKEVAALLAQREVRATASQLAASGAEVRYLPLDIRDREAVACAVQTVRQEWGQITGLIHGAGVLADRLILDKTVEQFELVFSTKVLGLAGLLEATASDPLRVVCLFSSIAARRGNPGQCDYAMANEVLNKVALTEATRRGADCLVKSINFGPWDGGMVNEGLKAHFASQGVALIPLKQGATTWVQELLEEVPAPVEIDFTAEPERVQARLLRFHTEVSQTSYPSLASHVINDVPVLPVALVAEWFTKAAQAFAPQMHLDSLNNLVVGRGVKLPGFSQNGDRFTIEACEEAVHRDQTGAVSERRLALKLFKIGDQIPRYRASAVLRRGQTAAPESRPALASEGPVSWTSGDLYHGRGVLFHGPALQVIDQIEVLHARGSIMLLQPGQHLGWPVDGTWLDPVLLDGVLQQALAQGFYLQQRRSLPTSVDVLRCIRPLGSQALRCILTPRLSDSLHMVADAVLLDAAGQVWAEILGITTHFYGEVVPTAAAAATAPKLKLVDTAKL